MTIFISAMCVYILAYILKRGVVAIVTLKTIQECCRVCNNSYFFLCLNLRQYDTFVALAIAFNLGRNKLPRPGPFTGARCVRKKK
jgi:hypothetical protein